MTVDGTVYGLPDDGDVFILYYRTDLFDDPENQAEFKAAHGYDLAPPET
jgi:multiple sugar transport system substrate-binding protein